MLHGSANGMVAATFRQLFVNTVAYLLNPASRGELVEADSTIEELEVVCGPKRIHIDEAFQDEHVLDQDGAGEPQQPVPMRHIALQRNNTIICEQYADEFVPPSVGNNAKVNDVNAAPAPSSTGFTFSTSSTTTSNASPANVLRALSSNVNPSLARAGSHVFSIGQSMTEARVAESDSDSADGADSISPSDDSEESYFSESEVDVDELHEFYQSQGVERKVKDVEEEVDELLKKEYPVVDVINDQPYCRVGKVLALAPSVRTSVKRSRSAYEADDDRHDDPVAIPETFSTPEDELIPPTTYRRQRRHICERRRVGVEFALVSGLHDVLMADSDFFEVQEKPSDVRMAHLGGDGLDDAPTPPGSPVKKRKRM